MSNKKLLILFAGLLLFPGLASAYEFRDVFLNEYMISPVGGGSSWVELRNTLSEPINLTGWSIVSSTTEASTTATTTLMDSLALPSLGLVVVDLGTPLDGAGGAISLLDQDQNIINSATYGSIRGGGYLSTPPTEGQSAISLNGPWSLSTGFGNKVVSRGWFWSNQGPTQNSVLSDLPDGISVNLSTSTDWTNLSGLILSRDGFDSAPWSGTHNLTSLAEREELRRLAIELASSTAPIPPEIIPPPVVSRHGGGGGSSYTPSALPIIELATSTGIVLGVKTFHFTRLLRPGMRGADVQELQKILKTSGFFKVSVTNYFGPATRQALTLWQKKNKIKPATGVVGRPTLNYLNNLSL